MSPRGSILIAEDISRRGIREEGVHYLPKPFTAQTLLEKVAHALR